MGVIFSFFLFFPFTLFVQEAQIPDSNQLNTPLKGIYITSHTISNKTGEALIEQFSQAGGNMIVFDVQDSWGRLAYPSNIPLSIELQNRADRIKDLALTVQRLHEKNFYVVARYVLFKNGFIAKKRPQWVLKRKKTDRVFVSRDGPVWLDPANWEFKQYIFDINREIAEAGVDEIQFDYARFPEGGKGGYIGYSFTGDDIFTRDQVITNFIAEVADQLHTLGKYVSIDVFGIVVWENISWKVIGQNIAELAKYVDAIYPMPYPSHFGYGWGGHQNPANEPYFFVQETTKKFIEQTAGTGVQIRPWLQGFSLRVSRFGPNYIKEQIRALNDINIQEFSVWNAANNYWATLGAVKSMSLGKFH